MTFDVVIVGGGVAAAAALCALRGSGLKLAVIAPAAKGGDRIGEMLSPSAKVILQQLGLWRGFLTEGHGRAQAAYSAWGSHQLSARTAILHPEGLGWHLDRPQFDAFLWASTARIDAIRLTTALRAARRQASGWCLRLADGGSIAARLVLDCSGRSAVVARALAARTREDRLLAAYAFLDHVEPDIEPTPATLIEAVPEGWWYSALLPDGRLVVAYFSDPDLLPKGLRRDVASWNALIESSSFTHARIETAGFAVCAPPALADSGSLHLESVAGDSWCAAGDAAAAFDPLSSHGITTALWSGRQAALGAQAFLEGDPAPLRTYAETMAAGLARYRLERRAVYARESRYADRPFWRRRHALEPKAATKHQVKSNSA